MKRLLIIFIGLSCITCSKQVSTISSTVIRPHKQLTKIGSAIISANAMFRVKDILRGAASNGNETTKEELGTAMHNPFQYRNQLTELDFVSLVSRVDRKKTTRIVKRHYR